MQIIFCCTTSVQMHLIRPPVDQLQVTEYWLQCCSSYTSIWLAKSTSFWTSEYVYIPNGHCRFGWKSSLMGSSAESSCYAPVFTSRPLGHAVICMQMDEYAKFLFFSEKICAKLGVALCSVVSIWGVRRPYSAKIDVRILQVYGHANVVTWPCPWDWSPNSTVQNAGFVKIFIRTSWNLQRNRESSPLTYSQ